MSSILAHFDALTERGLKVIPLRENSKIPLCKGWSRNWSREAARKKLQIFPDANIGLLLGEIIDVEGDSETANRVVCDLIGDYPHPLYQSSKSVHHLFLNPDRLRHFRHEDIEFRGWGHQSVLPPSRHVGTNYKWLSGFRFPVPEMPDLLQEFYQDKRHGIKKFKVPSLSLRCFRCEKKRFLHRKRFELELALFKLVGERWHCQACRNYDLRSSCRLMRAGAPDHLILSHLLQQQNRPH